MTSNAVRPFVIVIAATTIALLLLSGFPGRNAEASELDSTVPAPDTVLEEDAPTNTVTSEPGMTYTIYDVMEEPFGTWWTPRSETYARDFIISEGPGANTYLFMPDGMADGETQGIIYAPYRYNIVANDFTGINVHSPEFFKLKGSGPVAGAQADMNLYFQYMYESWYTSVRNDWIAGTYYGYLPSAYYYIQQDGFIVMTSYDIKMNRAGALEWLGLPVDNSDPLAWYAGVGAAYTSDYANWFRYEGDTRLDIAYAYEDNYYSLYTVSRLKHDVATDEVTLQLMHFSWGYEALMTRWLTEAGVSPNHEPWYEDFSLSVSYGEETSDILMDAVCQYSLHAVKADGTSDAPAWAWEPHHIDYATAEDLPVYFTQPADRPSEYLPYSTLTYQSWNSGDNMFGQEVGYEYTPYWFNLSEDQRLVFELPDTAVAGYLGQGLPSSAYEYLAWGDASAFEAIRDDGVLALGHYVSGGPDLGAMYDPATCSLVIQGPVSFDNVRHTLDGPLYHGAPWIEFDVGEVEGEAIDVYKLDGKMSDSSVWWDCSPSSDAAVGFVMENHGLRQMVVTISELDLSTMEYVVLWKERVRFSTPDEIVSCGPSPTLLAGHDYRVTYTPLGDVGTWAAVSASFVAPGEG